MIDWLIDWSDESLSLFFRCQIGIGHDHRDDCTWSVVVVIDLTVLGFRLWLTTTAKNWVIITMMILLENWFELFFFSNFNLNSIFVLSMYAHDKSIRVMWCPQSGCIMIDHYRVYTWNFVFFFDVLIQLFFSENPI